MTNVLIHRFHSDDDATVSLVYIDGRFQCFALEDEYRLEKVPGETRVPAGKYQVGVRTVGGFHNRYASKFPDIHRGMLQVLDVPGFEYILIHVGNTDEDTAGCLLVGQGAMVAGEISIQSSVAAYRELYSKLIEAAVNKTLTIEYVDADLCQKIPLSF